MGDKVSFHCPVINDSIPRILAQRKRPGSLHCLG